MLGLPWASFRALGLELNCLWPCLAQTLWLQVPAAASGWTDLHGLPHPCKTYREQGADPGPPWAGAPPRGLAWTRNTPLPSQIASPAREERLGLLLPAAAPGSPRCPSLAPHSHRLPGAAVIELQGPASFLLPQLHLFHGPTQPRQMGRPMQSDWRCGRAGS